MEMDTLPHEHPMKETPMSQINTLFENGSKDGRHQSGHLTELSATRKRFCNNDTQHEGKSRNVTAGGGTHPLRKDA
jgi:hypothetical protein